MPATRRRLFRMISHRSERPRSSLAGVTATLAARMDGCNQNLSFVTNLSNESKNQGCSDLHTPECLVWATSGIKHGQSHFVGLASFPHALISTGLSANYIGWHSGKPTSHKQPSNQAMTAESSAA